MYITGPCAPERPSGKILTYAEVLVYAYITVKFQLRSSINMPLTESSIWIGLHWKVPQNGVLRRILGVGAKIFGGNPLRMQRLPIYAFSFNAGTWRIDGRTDSIAICIHVILNFFCDRWRYLVGAVVQLVEYRTYESDTLPRGCRFDSHLVHCKQPWASLLLAQANSASYPQRDGT